MDILTKNQGKHTVPKGISKYSPAENSISACRSGFFHVRDTIKHIAVLKNNL